MDPQDSKNSVRVKSGRKITLTALMMVLLSALTAGPAVGAVPQFASSKKALTPLQKGIAFYRGKTITIISPESTGAGGDLEARFLGAAMGIYLHASVEVEDLPAGNTIAGQDALAASSPNGLTIGYLHVSGDVYDATVDIPGLNFNPLKEQFLGATPGHPAAVVAAVNSPFTTYASINKAATPPKFLTTGGSAYFTNVLINEIFGIHVSYVSSYANQGPLITGFQRGDGPLTEFAYNGIGTMLESNFARALLLLGPKGGIPESIKQYIKGVPTVAIYEKTHPVKSKEAQDALTGILNQYEITDIFAAPARTPSDEVAALQAAYRWASLNKTVKSEFTNALIPPGYISPTQARTIYLSFVKYGPAMLHYYNLGIG